MPRTTGPLRHRGVSWLLFAAFLSPLLPPALAQEEKKANDVVVYKRTMEEIRCRILMLDEKNNRLQYALPDGTVRSPVLLDQYEVKTWDGYTNAADLLNQAEKACLDVRQAALDLPVENPPPEAEQKLLNQRQAAEALLKRIRKETKESERASQLLELFSQSAIQLLLKQKAEILRESQALCKDIALGLDLGRYADVAKTCANVERRINRIPRPTDAEKTILSRFQESLQALREVSESLGRLGYVARLNDVPPADLPNHQKRLVREAAELERGARLHNLGNGIADRFGKRLVEVRKQAKQTEVYLAASDALVKAAAEWNEWTKKLENQEVTDLAAVQDRLDAMEKSLADLAVRLDKAPPGDATAYAREHLAKFQKDYEARKVGTLLAVELPRVVREIEAAKQAPDLPRVRSASQALSARRQSLQRYPAERLSPGQAARVKESLDRLGEQLLETKHTEARLRVEDVSGRLSAARQGLPKPASGGERALAEHVKNVSSALGELDALAKELQDLAKGAPKADSLDSLLKTLEAPRREGECTRWLLETQEALVQVPASVAGRKELAAADRLLAKANESFRNLPVTPPEAVKDLHEATRSALRDVSRGVDLVRGRLEFRERGAGLAAELDMAEAAVKQGRTGEAKVLLYDTGASIKRLRELLDTTPDLKEDSASAQLVVQQDARQKKLNQQARQLVHHQRLSAGWVVLPTDPNKVLPPTPENACLRIQLLIDARRLEEADKALTEFQAKYRLLVWEERAAALRAQLQLWAAADREKDGEFERAYDLYRQAAASSDPQVSRAATTAATRLEYRFRQEQNQARSHWRLLLTALAVLAVLAAAGSVGWLASPAGRLARARRLLKQADALDKNGDLDRRDEKLAQVYQAVAPLAAEHPAAAALLQRLEQDRAAPTVVASRTRKVRLKPTDAGDVARYLAALPAPSEPAARAAVEWLEAHRGDKRGKAVVAWLHKHLAPAEALPAAELRWRAELAAACGLLLQGEVWPLVYQAKAYGWLAAAESAAERAGHFQAALGVLEKLAYKQVKDAKELDHLLLLHGQCLLQLDRAAEAVKLLAQVQKQRGNTEAVRRWLAVANANAALAQHQGDGPALSAELAKELLEA